MLSTVAPLLAHCSSWTVGVTERKRNRSTVACVRWRGTERESDRTRRAGASVLGRGGEVCTISAGTVCAVPDRGDTIVAGITKRAAAPGRHGQTAITKTRLCAHLR